MDWSVLEKRLGVNFRDQNNLIEAVTHRSYLNENRGWPVGHNERLEFLGDSVLQLIVTTFLFRMYPSQDEGILTRFRTAMVNIDAITAASNELGINDFMLFSNGESKDTGHARQILIGNAFEAVVGAIYVDQGYEAAQKFVAKHILARAEELIKQYASTEWKSRLQEACQTNLHITPTYRLLEKTGPDHDPHFTVGVFFGFDLIAQGEGFSKKLAEQAAAKKAVVLKEW